MKLRLALVAENIHRSVLPRTYEFFGRDIGRDVEFTILNIPPENLAATIEQCKQRLDGFTVTMPYKVNVLEYCDKLDESAEKCGSANTVLVRNGNLIGYNTDGWGLVKCLALKGHDFAGKKATLIGAGGVGLSIAYNLSICGVGRVDVLNIDEAETSRLAAKMGGLFIGHRLTRETLALCTPDADYFINASVLGQVGFPDFDDLDFLDHMKRDAIVFDVNYSNPHAKLPHIARQKHLRTYVGKAMSSCQGIRAMEIWTGKTPRDAAAIQLVSRIENEQ